jgi:hypothetical protein
VRVVLVALLLASAASACGKGKPAPQTAPDNVGSGDVEALKGDKGHLSKVPGYASDITVPKGTGAPPVKTTGPIDADKLKSLGETQFPGFRREVKTADSTKLVVEEMTGSRPAIRAIVTIQPCSKDAPCTPINLPAWQAKAADLRKSTVRPDLDKLPDTTFEVASDTLNGTTVISTYAVGFLGKMDENGNPAGSYQNAYEAYFNDGQNQISVSAEYYDDQPKSLKALQGYTPKSDLQKVALGFLDLFTQNW